ncbi:hypothetical protein [Pseudomonas rossensis]|uniref:hypothetical protein n=1 Tax=Pseudomonas rossensis TaxID=2305471 RepID=UPI0032609B18
MAVFDCKPLHLRVMTSENALPLVLIPGFMLDETLWDEVIENMPSNRENLLQGQTILQPPSTLQLLRRHDLLWVQAV